MLLLLPLDLPEPARLRLPGQPDKALHDLALAVHHAHNGQWTHAHAQLALVAQGRGVEGDLAQLVRAAIRAEQRDWPGTLALAWEVLPFVIQHRAATVFTHLLIARAALASTNPELALHAAMEAHAGATTPGSRHLRVPALCLWAESLQNLHEYERAQHQARRALRLASTSLNRYLAHATLARVSLRDRPYTAAEHARKAAVAAPAEPLRREMDRLLDQALDHLSAGAPLVQSPHRRVRAVHLDLFGGPSITVDGLRHDATRHPRVVLLLSYLRQEPYAGLSSAAEALLPHTTHRRVKYDDESHRVARIRQDVNRARAVLGDPGAVICEDATLRLSAQYHWSSDLDALPGHSAAWPALPASLRCPWLEDLQDQSFTPSATPG